MKLFGSFDTETDYGKDYSVSDMGVRAYVTDPRFDCYMIGFSAEDGFEWRGHPKDAPWSDLARYNFLSHNAGFDRGVLRRLIELGKAPESVWPEVWHCTANLAVYVGLPRALAKAVEVAFHHTISKNIRNVEMKDKSWHMMSADLQARVLQYALDDARWSLKLWQTYSAEWPEHERLLSADTYEMCEYGFHVDREGVERDIEVLRQALFAAKSKIPWRDEAKILSPKALATHCRANGIEPPSSLAKDSEECAAWEDQYGAQFPWVAAMRDYRRVNTLLEKYIKIRDRIDTNGRMPYSVLYFGASTGRWSGSGGINMQNLSRDPFYFDDAWSITHQETERSVELRPKFVAAPGHKLIIADFAQIEARITPWLAGDKETIELVRKGISVYDAHGLKSGVWDGQGGSLKKVNKLLYMLCKIQTLGLGFGCGWFKFLVFAKALLKFEEGAFEQIFNAPVTNQQIRAFIEYIEKYDRKGTHRRNWVRITPLEQTQWINSWLQVTSYRAANPKIVALWRRLGDDIKRSIGGKHEITLPSGRVLHYFNVSSRGDGITVQTTRGGNASFVTGPLLLENAVQSTARDVLGYALLNLKKEGIRVIGTVHDEAICEMPKDFRSEIVGEIMTQNPPWAKSLPLGAEVVESPFYLK